METGFLNPIHDEEHFTSSFYSQGNGLDDTDHMLFGEMIVPEIIDYDNLWETVDDSGTSGVEGESRKEDFQRMLYEWQHQLNYMQEPEAIKQILPVAEKTTQEVSNMFASTNSSCVMTSDIDELFPLETKEALCAGSGEEFEEIPFIQVPSRTDVPAKTDDPLRTDFLTRSDFLTKTEIVTRTDIATRTDVLTTADYPTSIDVPTSINVPTSIDVPKIMDLPESINAPTSINVPTSIDVLTGIDAPAKADIPLKSIETVAPVNIKMEKEDHIIDIESVDEEIPLLMAGDLTSLLEQFEATEKVNSVPPPAAAPPSPPRPSNQTIRDALPAEVINRIKATRENHKKMISLIPAMPSKRPGRAATRMQDAGAALSRNKLLKLVTGGSSGESVQLDHDYCSSGDAASNSSRSYCVSDSSEYPSQSSTPDAVYSRIPEYYTALAPQRTREQARVVDTGSRKDSGLESGENSEEDVQPVIQTCEVKKKVVLKSVTGLKSVNVVTENGVIIGSAPVLQNVPMVSVLKKNNIKVENEKKPLNSNVVLFPDKSSPVIQTSSVNVINAQDTSKKKKKLNLEEYRVRREERERIRSQESSRASSPAVCSTPPAQPDSTSTTVLSTEGIPKEKPQMMSVEVQTQTCDFVDLTGSTSPRERQCQTDLKEKRLDIRNRSYRSHHASSSSSSSGGDSDRRSRRRKRSPKRSKHRKNSVSRMWSRSRSRSSSRSHSHTSSRSRSRSRSHDMRRKWRSRSPHRSNNRYSSSANYHSRDGRDRGWQRSRSPMRGMHCQELSTQEKVRQVEERRVIYVGRIEEGTTKAELRKRFQQFGPIVDISVHFRERGDNYGFVTFLYKADAYKAVEHGNDDTSQPHYDLCFGGRRAFCKQRYADLDGIATSIHNEYGPPVPHQRPNDSFDLLLHEVKVQMRKRSSV